MNVTEFPMEEIPSAAPTPPARPRDIDEKSYMSMHPLPEKDEVLSSPDADNAFCEY